MFDYKVTILLQSVTKIHVKPVFWSLLVILSTIPAPAICAVQKDATTYLTTTELIKNIERRHNGKIVSIEKSKDGLFYKIRLLNSKAEVITLIVNVYVSNNTKTTTSKH